MGSLVWVLVFKFKMLLFFKDFIYLPLERREGREKEGEKHQCVRDTADGLPLTHPHLETWPATQARALTGTESATFWFAVGHSDH